MEYVNGRKSNLLKNDSYLMQKVWEDTNIKLIGFITRPSIMTAESEKIGYLTLSDIGSVDFYNFHSF